MIQYLINRAKYLFILPAIMALTLSVPTNCTTGIIRHLATAERVISSIIPLYGLITFERLVRNVRTARLSEYKGDFDCTLVSGMARQMNLDPEQIPVYKWNNGSPAATCSFTRNILLIPSINVFNLNNDENRFVMGHELAHMAYKHILKRYIMAMIAPWAVYAGCTLTDKLIHKMLRFIGDKFGAEPDSRLDKTLRAAHKISHFLLRNPLMQILYTNRLNTHYARSQEKQADLESAKQFCCAEHGITFFQKADELQTSLFGRIGKKIFQWTDSHPTCAERIAYLRPIAEAQARTYGCAPA